MSGVRRIVTKLAQTCAHFGGTLDGEGGGFSSPPVDGWGCGGRGMASMDVDAGGSAG